MSSAASKSFDHARRARRAGRTRHSLVCTRSVPTMILGTGASKPGTEPYVGRIDSKCDDHLEIASAFSRALRPAIV
jgi:hypothetical protein